MRSLVERRSPDRRLWATLGGLETAAPQLDTSGHVPTPQKAKAALTARPARSATLAAWLTPPSRLLGVRVVVVVMHVVMVVVMNVVVRVMMRVVMMMDRGGRGGFGRERSGGDGQRQRGAEEELLEHRLTFDSSFEPHLGEA
jgi:hypothetical protein